jgi:hypothetical protein
MMARMQGAWFGDVVVRRRTVLTVAVGRFGFAQTASSSTAAAIVREPFWISVRKWRDKPNELPGQFTWAKVMAFGKGGDLRMAECYLTRLGDVVSVSEGDGFIRYLGAWREVANELHIEYALNSPTRLLSKPIVTGPPKRAQVMASRKGRLLEISVLGTVFYPNRMLTMQQLNYLLGTPK